MSIDVNVQNDLVIVTESSEDIVVNVSNAAGPQGPAGTPGQGVPVGGSTGQVLKKFTNSNYDTYWAADASGLTSVGLSMPSGFNVSNSPLTSNGTISVSGAGTTLQYLRGDGSLATFPSIPGGTVTSINLTAGTGVSVSGGPITTSGSILVTNTAPDQVVSLTGGGTTTITGTYPNFTISSADSKLGTVTSVDMTVPTGLTISGNPITSAGTLAVALASGYSIPTTASQANWNTAYNDSIVSAAVTGTTTKTLTLNQQDGGTVTASWSDLNTDAVTSVFGRTGAVTATEGDYTLTQLGDVTLTSPTNGQVLKYNGTTWINNTDTDTGLTSVGLTMPSAFSVSNSPLTSNGTIAVTGAGTVNQYVRGDGALATFPSTAGGGSSVNYYLNGSIASGVSGYQQMANNAVIGAGTNFSLVGNGLLAQFLTDAGNPNRVEIPGGAWNFEMYFSVSSVGGAQKFYVELYKYNGSTFTLIASNSSNPEAINGGTATDLYLTSLAVPTTSLLVTDRLALRVYIIDNSGARTVTLHTEDNNLCQIVTTFANGVASLNGLTANTQYFATGTSGTDFSINSVTDTHTFNLPIASGTNTGKLSNTDWTTFNSKQNAITLTTTGASGASTLVGSTLNIPQYADQFVGTVTSVSALTLGTTGTDLSSTVANGTTTPVITLNVPTASATNRGALSSADWTTFNNKQNTITNPVTGTGTTNYLPKWTSGSAIGNSNLINDASGNLGLGVVPSSWANGIRSLEISLGNGLWSSTPTQIILNSNSIYTSGGFTYASSNASAYYSQFAGGHYWYNAPSGTAGNAITFTQAMTLTSGGNLLLNSTSDNGNRLQVNGVADALSFLVPNGGYYKAIRSSGSLVIDLLGIESGTDNTRLLITGDFNIKNGSATTLMNMTALGATTFSSSVTATNGVLLGGNSDVLNFKFSSGYGNTSLATIFDSNADAGNHLIFKINNAAGTATERMRIVGNGNLLVGTTTDSGERVQVSGTMKVTGAATFSSDVTVNGVLKEIVTTNRQTASYTLALADRGKLVEMNVATANNLTVPLNSSIAFPIGTKIDLAQYGAGQTTVVATGGVTVRSAGGALKLTSQYSGATLVKIATDEWYLFGNITV